MPSIEQAAARLGVEVRMLRIEASPNDVLSRIQAWRADALVVGGDQTTRQHCRRIVEFANGNRIPAAFAFKECMDAGGLIAYADDVPEAIRRTAVQLDRILRGARPAELPVEQPTRFELVVNLKTAKALGLTVPQSILVRADRVIE
jgi:putative ABC transport system substrate-binding protein